MELDYEFIKNLVLVVIPTLIGIIGSKLLVNSWQIKKEKFALRKSILTNFEETWPLAESMIYAFYLKISSEYADVKQNVEYVDGKIDVNWKYPIEESEKPFNKFNEDFNLLTQQLSKIAHKINGFRGLIILYFEESEAIIELFDSLRSDMHGYHLRIDHMVHSKNIDVLLKGNNELLELRDIIGPKIYDLEKILIESDLKNPKT